MFIVISVAALVSVAASVRFAKRFRLKKQFSWNSLLVALSYLALWTPVALADFLSYGPFHIEVPTLALQVTSLIGVISPLATIVLRLSYSPIWEALCFNPLSRPPRTSFQSLSLRITAN